MPLDLISAAIAGRLVNFGVGCPLMRFCPVPPHGASVTLTCSIFPGAHVWHDPSRDIGCESANRESNQSKASAKEKRHCRTIKSDAFGLNTKHMRAQIMNCEHMIVKCEVFLPCRRPWGEMLLTRSNGDHSSGGTRWTGA